LLNELITLAQHHLSTNAFLVGGLGTVVVGAVIAAARNIPLQIWNGIYNRTTLRTTILSDNPNFAEIATELNKNTINFLSRSAILQDEELSVGFGSSWSRIEGHLAHVNRSKEQSDSGNFKQTITITTFFMRRKTMADVMNKYLNKVSAKNEGKTSSFKYGDNWASLSSIFPNRTRKTTLIDEDQLKYIEDRLDFFVNNRDWYIERGIPYKFAILLYGVPGTGKSSLAKYIANYVNRDIWTCKPNELSSTVEAYMSKMNQPSWAREKNPKESIILMEDIDCDPVTKSRDLEDVGKIVIGDLSSLLNAIDGINSPDGGIIVATTNHIEVLDAALLRKGRFDDTLEIKPLTHEYIVRMVKQFFKIDVLNAIEPKVDNIPGAVIQDIILQTYSEGVEETVRRLNNEFG
jgi:chaperone BCS1